MSIDGTTVEVSKKVANFAVDFHSLSGTSAVWVATINQKVLQLVVVTPDELILGLDTGPLRISWSDITIIGPSGVTTPNETFDIDLGGTTMESMAWIAEYFCPTARRVSLGQSEKHVPYGVRSEEWRRARNRRITDALRRTGGKWENAMEGSRFNAFSLMGTADWEDYATASMTAMSLEALTDLSERVENLEKVLTEIRDLLAARLPNSPAVDRFEH